MAPSLSGSAVENPSKPRITWRGVLIAGVLWVLYALFYATLVAQSARIPYVYALLSMSISTALMALYTVPAWLLIIRQMDGVSWPWRLAAHAVVGPVYSAVWYQSYVVAFRWAFGPETLKMAQLVENRWWLVSSTFIVYLLQFAIFHVIRSTQRLRDKERLAAELQRLAHEREMAALKAQINPHFLFNTLNSISAMVTRDPEETRRMIARLAELLRYALDSSERDFVTLRDELYFVQSYLEIESKRFGRRLRVEQEIAPETMEVLVPPMILQPLVENAVRHGIAPSEEGGKVTLRILSANGRLLVRVEDTGVGVENRDMRSLTQNGVGLKNTDARLRKLFGPEAGLQLVPREPHGFRVSFSIPMSKPEEGR
jgi:signal transduction histidine kinase